VVVICVPQTERQIVTSCCKLIPVNARRFTFLVQQTPFFAIHVMKMLAERLRAMNEVVGSA
jgi:CRP/FNR family cyclic AMP-dependent transcriptional regulator